MQQHYADGHLRQHIMDGEIEAGTGNPMSEDGVGPRMAHLRVHGGLPGEALYVMSPDSWASTIAQMMDTAHSLGGQYREALESKIRYRRLR